MVQAELKHLLCIAAPDGLEVYRPADPVDFALDVQALVGQVGEGGEESFAFTVTTPTWLAGHAGDGKGFTFLRHVLLVESWDAKLVERAIRDLVGNTTGADWNEVAMKLSRFGYWEFEDYRER
jgi:hypothetical protein